MYHGSRHEAINLQLNNILGAAGSLNHKLCNPTPGAIYCVPIVFAPSLKCDYRLRRMACALPPARAQTLRPYRVRVWLRRMACALHQPGRKPCPLPSPGMVGAHGRAPSHQPGRKPCPLRVGYGWAHGVRSSTSQAQTLPPYRVRVWLGARRAPSISQGANLAPLPSPGMVGAHAVRP